MTHLKEDILDLYVLVATTLDSAAVSKVERHLTECTSCREWVEYLRDFYATYEEAAPPQTAQLEPIADPVKPLASVYELRPFRSATKGLHQARSVNTILAAGTTSLGDAQFRRLAVLASESEGIVLRVIYDTVRSELQVYLLGGNPERRKYAIVAFPFLNIECVTDDSGNGRVKIDDLNLDVDWDRLYAQVRLPLDEFCAPESGTLSHSVGQPPRYSVTVRREQLQLRIETTTLEDESPLLLSAVVTGPDNYVELVHISDGATSITLPHSSAGFTIRLYS